MKKVFFLVFSVLFIVSCNTNDNFFEGYYLEPVENIELPLLDSVRNFLVDAQFYQTDTAVLFFLYTKSDYIYVYNFDKSTIIRTIPLKKDKPLYSFNVLNLDSILLFYNPGHFYNYVDSVIQIVDFNGNLKANYVVDNLNFKTNSNNISDTDCYYIHSVFNKAPTYKDKIFFLVSKFNQYELGDSLSRSAKLPPVAFLNYSTNTTSFIDFPYIFPPKGTYYPQAFNHYFVSLSFDNNILFSTRYSNLIYEYNWENSEITKHYIKSEILDTIEPVKDFYCSDQLSFINDKGSFAQIFYDSYNQIYIKPVIMPVKKYNNNIFVVSDTNFKKIGEGIFPVGVSFNMLFLEKYIILWNKKETYNKEGKIVFTKFILKKKKVDENIFLDSLRFEIGDTSKCTINYNNEFNRLPIQDYLVNFINKEKYAVLIVPFLYSCPSCKDYAVLYYALNKELFSEKNVFLMFDSQNRVAIKSYLNKYHLGLKNSKIILDTILMYDKFVSENFYNPRVVVVCDNNVVFDKTFKPKELEGIDSVLFKFVFEEMCP